MRKEPEVVTVTLKKHNGMGLSIVAAKVGNAAWKCVFVSDKFTQHPADLGFVGTF